MWTISSAWYVLGLPKDRTGNSSAYHLGQWKGQNHAIRICHCSAAPGSLTIEPYALGLLTQSDAGIAWASINGIPEYVSYLISLLGLT